MDVWTTGEVCALCLLSLCVDESVCFYVNGCMQVSLWMHLSGGKYVNVCIYIHTYVSGDGVYVHKSIALMSMFERMCGRATTESPLCVDK